MRGVTDPRYIPAEPRSREHFAWIAQAGGIERAAQQLHRVEIVSREHPGHVAGLVDADAVLARDRAAVLDAEVKDHSGQLLSCLLLACDGIVEEHELMQVPVSGVVRIGGTDSV